MTKKDFLIKKGGKAKILRFILFHKVQTKKVYYKITFKNEIVSESSGWIHFHFKCGSKSYFYLTILIFVLRATFFVLIDNSLLDPDPWIRIFLRIQIQEA